MKNNFKLFVVLLFTIQMSSITFAQNNPIDFEPSGLGGNWTWTIFENVDNPPLEVIANPDASGNNTSATVAKFTARLAGAPYAGCITQGAGVFNLDSTNCTIKIMVWKSVISDVGIKFEASFASTGEIKVANTLVNQWEELTFDFSGKIGEPSSTNIDGLIIFPDFNTRTTENIIYFDNITFSAGGGSSTDPTVAAPTPPVRDPASVISLFSEAYTNVPVDTWRTSWSSATLTEVTIAGNPTKKYSQLDFVGIETVANQLNITGMTHLHMDVWSSDFTQFGVKLVDFGANGAFGGGDDVEHQVNFTSPAQGEWVSLDIPLSDFTGLTTREHIAQYILVGQPTGSTTVYVDNFYFYNSIVPVELSSFSANVNGSNVNLAWSTATETNNSGFEIQRKSGEDFVSIGFVRGSGTTTELQNYSFTDTKLSAGNYSYRLKQVDFDGSFEYSNVVNVDLTAPTVFSLEQNYPNPFNPSTVINYNIPQNSFVTLKVYDVIGNEVATLVNQTQSAGKYEVRFDASNLSNGVYMYSIKTDNFTSTKKMILMK